jgi:hypothetical protein
LNGPRNHKSGVGHFLLSKFHEGDLVSWKKLGSGEKTYAMIIEILEKTFFNDRVFFTAIVITSRGEKKEMNLGLLKLESSSVKGK